MCGRGVCRHARRKTAFPTIRTAACRISAYIGTEGPPSFAPSAMPEHSAGASILGEVRHPQAPSPATRLKPYYLLDLRCATESATLFGIWRSGGLGRTGRGTM